MPKKIPQIEKKVSAARKKNRLMDMLPFVEKPSRNRYGNKNGESKKELIASDLFSIFTADVIKQDVIFTR